MGRIPQAGDPANEKKTLPTAKIVKRFLSLIPGGFAHADFSEEATATSTAAKSAA